MALPIAVEAGRLLHRAPATKAIQLLADIGEVDLTVARVVEPHVDALTILTEAELPSPSGVWGVFAAEAPGAELRAERSSRGWMLTGVKPWCSLAGLLDQALVTAKTPDGRGLFRADLHDRGVHICESAWIARGLASVVTSDVAFDAVPATPVGAHGWYLSRPGFGWGGIRVAACWAGATRALVAYLAAALEAREREDPVRADPVRADPVRAVSLGRSDVAAWSANLALQFAGCEIDGGRAVGRAGALLAARTRAVVADAAETVLREVGHALGPAPLAFDDEHARRVADLTLYVRQHHAERDLAALASLALEPDRRSS
jgi:alkylation response protein AidB-like acyl-CoA dehydrogenase